MSRAYGARPLPPDVENLRTKLLATLDTPVAVDGEEAALLEQALRTRLVDHLDPDGTPVNPPLTSATVDTYIGILREVGDQMLARRRSVAFDAPSAACQDAAVIGVLLISAGTGIHPYVGIAAFVVALGYAVEACVF